MKAKLTRDEEIIKSVTRLKESTFGATALKIELEAQLSRENCEGHHNCNECDGDWENFRECTECGGLGFFRRDGDEFVACDDSHNDAEECEDCYGAGTINCQYCDEGRQDCDGDCGNEWNINTCHDFIMSRLQTLGLAEQGATHRLGHGMHTVWHPVLPLAYAETYNDGSVDTEVTFTLMLDAPENVHYAPKIIGIFKELADEVGNGMDVMGAGMHMALLRSPDGVYPDGRGVPKDQHRYKNFKSSMQMLLPALYCLASPDGSSRDLGYRQPDIGWDTHRAAIDFRQGALEFRIFDTCYDRPEAVLDNIIVMSKCLRYWSDERVPTGMHKIATEATFGTAGHGLSRLYVTTTHAELLNAGLRKLKPDYLTVRDIKVARGLKVDKTAMEKLTEKTRQDAELSYQEYAERFNWRLKIRELRLKAEAMDSTGPDANEADIERRVQEQMQPEEVKRKKLDDYISEKIAEFNARQGDFTLFAA
jgi:hypothetical protein